MPDPSLYVRVVAVVDQGPNHRGPLARVHTITSDQDTANRAAAAIVDRAIDSGHPLPGLAATQTVWVVPIPADVLALIAELTDPTCTVHRPVTHGWNDEPDCPHSRARKLLAAARTEGLMPDGA